MAILRSAPPSAGITINSAASSEVKRKKAIRAPSGDHAGLASCAGWLVKLPRFAGSHKLEVDIEVVLSRPVPGERDLTAVR